MSLRVLDGGFHFDLMSPLDFFSFELGGLTVKDEHGFYSEFNEVDGAVEEA